MTINGISSPRSLRKGHVKVAKWLLRILGILLLAGLVYQFVASRVDEGRYPPPGQLVKVQNTRLHVYCLGAGNPTVLLETAEGDIGIQFQPLMSKIAKFARVCTYDRPGTGWSDPMPGVQTADDSATLFHEALQIIGEQGPYVVAGHSIGGLYSQAFARQYRSEVVGAVLIDSVSQDVVLRMPSQTFANFRQARKLFRVLQIGTPFGLPRLIGVGKVTGGASGLSKETKLAIESRFYTYSIWGELVDALQAAERMSSIPGPKPDFGDLPLIVLVRDENVIYARRPNGLSLDVLQQGEQTWLELQREHAQMSSRGELILAENSDHYIYLDRPELVLESLQRVISIATDR